jgi:hypothetical protein
MPTPSAYAALADTQTLRQKLERMRSEMEADREQFIDHWKLLANAVSPRRARFHFEENAGRGQRVNHKILDNTPTLAYRVFRAGFMAGNTSPSSPWFRLGLDDLKLSQQDADKQWLYEVTNLMRMMFLRSNLYKALPGVYGDLGLFGTAAMMVEEDIEDVIRCHVFAVGSFMIGQDAKGTVNKFFREFTMTVQQVVEEFGMPDGAHGPIDWTNISEPVQAMWYENQREGRVYVCHAIYPNEDYDPESADSRRMKYASVYYEKGYQGNGQAYQGGFEDRYLRRSGYRYFPVLAPRWETSGEDVYATNCPGMEMLGDGNQLQKMESKALIAIAKMVDPPLNVPSSMLNDVVSLIPGDKNFVPDTQQGVRPVHEVDFRLDYLDAREDRCRARIDETWYKPLFISLLMSDRREMTAREVQERHEEKLLMVGPVLSSVENELLSPLIDITFDIMLRQGLIPEPPEEIQGLPLKVEFISIMAQAAKLAQANSLERFLGVAAQMAAAKPDVLDKIDADQTIDELAEIYSVPPGVVVSDENVAAMRQARAQLQARQAAVEQAGLAAKAAKDLSGAKMDEDNALSRVAESGALEEVLQ